MARGWGVTAIDAIPDQDDDDPRWKAVRHHFGIRAFGVNAWVAQTAGAEVIEKHDEVSGGAGSHEELYVVTQGRATFTVDGETVAAPAGALVWVGDPSLERVAVADEPGTTIVSIGAKVGEPFEPSPWELKHVDGEGST
jgi:hypothetical protein